MAAISERPFLNVAVGILSVLGCKDYRLEACATISGPPACSAEAALRLEIARHPIQTTGFNLYWVTNSCSADFNCG